MLGITKPREASCAPSGDAVLGVCVEDHGLAHVAKQHCEAWAGKESNGHPGTERGRIPTFALQREEPAHCRHGNQSLKSLHCQKSGSHLVSLDMSLLFVHKVISDSLNYTTPDSPQSSEAFIFF